LRRHCNGVVVDAIEVGVVPVVKVGIILRGALDRG
jgi:hypothetical protein